MNARSLAALLVLLASPAVPQGYAGLSSDAEGFALPSPDTDLTFPADHGPHEDFRIEWWYVTANLEGPDGTPYGAQWTLFRSALAPGGGEGWTSPQVWFGHAAVTTPDAHLTAERFARGGIGQAGVTADADAFDAWIDEWRMTGEGLSDVTLTAQGTDFALDLALRADGPVIPQGDGGYSVKSEAGQASMYYSQPFYEVTGDLTLPDGAVEVTGRAWLDREWSSQPLATEQTGWDWVSLHLGDGTKLMGYRLRDQAGGDYTTGTWIADGAGEEIPPGDLTMEPLGTMEVAGHTLPSGFRVTLPERGLDVTVRPVNRDAWMPMAFAYWEGPVTVEGSTDGIGYLEMVGHE